MKSIFTMILFASCITAFSQTSTELLGRWKLVKQTKDGITTTPAETYQVFEANGKFTGINGSKSRRGKWTLSDDGKVLNISISIIKISFNVKLFTTQERVIYSAETGTLEYIKVDQVPENLLKE